MAIRRREVHPDAMMRLKSGEEIPVVSDEAYLEQLLEVGRMQCFAGGTINGTMLRHPTGLPGEMVTVGAVIEWKDRTDAREQPEPVATPITLPPDDDAEEDDEQPVYVATVSTPPAEAALARVDQALQGQGAGALPFQRGDADAQPVDGEVRSGQLVGLSTSPEVPQAPVPPIEQRVAHEEGSHYKPVGPAPGRSDEGVNDGLAVDENAVDDSEIPEHLR